MNKNLIAANLMHHPGRTLASAAGVALGVILVVLTVGLVRGMLRDRGQRDTNLGIELLVSESGQAGISITSLPVSMHIGWGDRLREIPGVRAVTPVAQHLEMKGESGIGLRQIDGVDFSSYAAAANIRIVQGEALPATGDALIVDVKYAAGHKTKPGDRINLMGRDFTVAGIYEPETGARMMIPLQTMQESLGASDKCSMFLIKCDTPARQEFVARQITDRFPDLRVIFVRDLPTLFAQGYTGFNLFLNVVAGLAAAISLLVISLTMYSSVTERTRQIGILKSLGASKKYIAAVFIQESLLISAIGVGGGILLAVLARFLFVYGMGIRMEIETGYVLQTAIGGILSGVLGALIPAMRAAIQDPVEALSYE